MERAGALAWLEQAGHVPVVLTPAERAYIVEEGAPMPTFASAQNMVEAMALVLCFHLIDAPPGPRVTLRRDIEQRAAYYKDLLLSAMTH